MGKKKPKSKASKPTPSASESSYTSELDYLTAALSAANQTVFMKVCRLCESKDGPFLNIFDADKVTAKKIDELMPFKILENDDLPHKICFRCSAKVEELYEFINKCMKTQHSLHSASGAKEPIAMKTKTRALWEEKLNKSNISNDDICDALIKKAMEGIKDIPLNMTPLEEKTVAAPASVKKDAKLKPESKKELKNSDEISSSESDRDISLKQIKLTLDKCDEKKFIPTRTSRSQNQECLLDGLPDTKRIPKRPNKQTEDLKQDVPLSSRRSKKKTKQSSSEEGSSSDLEVLPSPQGIEPLKTKPIEPPKPVEPPKPFDIMDHVSTIKVNGVGVLFQCKLCVRNFLKLDVVKTHSCAKTGGVPKVDFTKSVAPPEPPKAPSVKYINTKTDRDLVKLSDNKTASVKNEKEEKKPAPEIKPKPRIGPASRVKRDVSNPMIGMTVAPINDEPPPPPAKPAPPPEIPPTASSIQIPSIPSLSSRYKLVPGPNNTFHLVEESSNNAPVQEKIEEPVSKPSKKRKSDEPFKSSESKNRRYGEESSRNKLASDIINLEETEPEPKEHSQPYPVGLFSTLPHHSSVYPTPVTTPPTFTTPAMKKQSYTIVQTGNPSKLLISTKPQPPVEEPSKKRQRKLKHDLKNDDDDKQPFKVTLEDAVPPPKDSFFTFINVDPLLQPSYVLPTNNIIQESQISTSTPASKNNADSKDKDKYACNMCEEKFTREKKLLAHIQSHYSKMDEEDLIREKNSRRRSKK